MLRATSSFEELRSCRCQLERRQKTEHIGQNGENRSDDTLVKPHEKTVTRRYEKKYIYHNIVVKNKILTRTKPHFVDVCATIFDKNPLFKHLNSNVYRFSALFFHCFDANVTLLVTFS